MLFEDDYNGIIYDRIAEVVRNQDGIFASKEDFLSQFCDWHKVEVTMKTFNKWLEKCQFKVFDQVRVVCEGVSLPHIKGSITDPEAVAEFMDMPVMKPIPQNPVVYGVPHRHLSLSDEDAFDTETKEDLK